MKSNGPPSRSCMKSPSLRATSREAPFSSRIFLVTARVSGVSKTVRRAPGYRFAHSTAYVPGPPPRSRTRSPFRKGIRAATMAARSRALSSIPRMKFSWYPFFLPGRFPPARTVCGRLVHSVQQLRWGSRMDAFEAGAAGGHRDCEAPRVRAKAPGKRGGVGRTSGQSGKDAEIHRGEQDHGTLVPVGHLHEIFHRSNLNDRLLPRGFHILFSLAGLPFRSSTS